VAVLGLDQEEWEDNTRKPTSMVSSTNSEFFKSGEFNNMFRDFEDFFGMGGMGQQQGKASRGNDIMLNLEITFMEAVMGVTKEISFSKKGTCTTCQGSRCKPGTSPTKCTTCGGSGHVNMRQGPMSIHMVCSKCKGSGESIKNPCNTCAGTGTANVTARETISIPKGINNGQNIRINGKGGVASPDVPPGDLIIKITVKPDTYFKRDGFDIQTTAYLSVPQVYASNLGCPRYFSRHQDPLR
jgi:molecular chaperone DnaJ